MNKTFNILKVRASGHFFLIGKKEGGGGGGGPPDNQPIQQLLSATH